MLQFIQNTILQYTAGAVISAWALKFLYDWHTDIQKKSIEKLQSTIDSINNEHLRNVAKDTVRWVGSVMPDAPNNVKLQEAIKKAQELTPNIIISDDKLKVFIESAYIDWKNNLTNLK